MTTPSTAIASSVPNGPRQRVLVVEDLEDTRESLKELLQVSLGLDVDIAEDGARGLALLREQRYSLVITDLRMPKISGMKLIETVQAEKIPVTVIVTTGHGSIKEAVEAMRCVRFSHQAFRSAAPLPAGQACASNTGAPG